MASVEEYMKSRIDGPQVGKSHPSTKGCLIGSGGAKNSLLRPQHNLHIASYNTRTIGSKTTGNGRRIPNYKMGPSKIYQRSTMDPYWKKMNV
ncbi:hypothetical protein Trydic_g287 [Trypoxylus dichotomus]